MSETFRLGMYAYGTFGAPAGDDPDQQTADFKTWLTAIGQAGYNVLVMSTFHVDPHGNLFDSAPVATDGVFNPLESSQPSKALNPQLPALLADFKATYGAKVYYSVGNSAGTAGDMTNLETLLSGYSCVQAQSNPTSPDFENLVSNLKLLGSALHIDGIDFDFEPVAYDASQQTLVSQFTCLLHNLGFGVTYCPYRKTSFWIDAQAAACDPEQTGSGTSKVDWWNLQCYGNGPPTSWTKAIEEYIAAHRNRLGIADPGRYVMPGYSSTDGPPCTVQQQVYAAVTATPPTAGGGWIWQLGQFDLSSPNLESALSGYATAIVQGQSGPPAQAG